MTSLQSGADQRTAAPDRITRPVAPMGFNAHGAGVSVARAVLESILAAARAACPHECCGLLVGCGVHVVSAVPVDNVAESANRFELHAMQQIAAECAAFEIGLDVLGVYHSHPSGDVIPSAADRDGVVWPDLPPFLQVIVSPDGRHAAYDSGADWAALSVTVI